MSLILDALNRSRQDAEPMPGLATQHYADVGSDAGGRRQYLPWLALVVALIVIGWLLLDRDGQPAPAHVEPTVQTAPVPPPTPDAAAPPPASTAALALAPAAAPARVEKKAEPVPVAPAVVAARGAQEKAIDLATKTSEAPSETVRSPAVAALYQQREMAQAEAKQPGATQARQPVKEAEPASQQNQQQAAGAETAATGREEQPIDVEKMLLQARDEADNAELEQHSAPFLAGLSQQTKNSIPTVLYQRHDYSDSKARSSVVLNGKSLRVGGSPLAGMKVDEILPDSVVLSYRGTQFRLRALNSWVNL